ncbi:MAG: electron transfer flavoprotein subunit alpha/FixB family protein [Bacteroidota bacterium]
MNNVCVYCELGEEKISDVSFELLTKGRSIASQLNCHLEALLIGHNLESFEKEIFQYGVDILYTADDSRLAPYSTLSHASIMTKLFREQKPQIALLGATTIGRDLGPRVSSALKSGLTADCTELKIGNHEEHNNTYKDLLYQIRPAFGGNIIATIINPNHRPQMATVREGVMKKTIYNQHHEGKVVKLDVNKYVDDTCFVVKIIERHLEKSKINIKNSPIIISGGFGIGSAENFQLLFKLASVIGGEVGASRAAVDAGFAEHARQVGQTGVTVRPKLYIACGISGQIQHLAGMQGSSIIISINNDPNAPINKIANYVIVGKVENVIPKIIKHYKENTK